MQPLEQTFRPEFALLQWYKRDTRSHLASRFWTCKDLPYLLGTETHALSSEQATALRPGTGKSFEFTDTFEKLRLTMADIDIQYFLWLMRIPLALVNSARQCYRSPRLESS